MTVSSGNTAGTGLPTVFDRYRPDGSALFDVERLATADAAGTATPTPYDEMIDGSGRVRPAWTDLVAGYGLRGDPRLRAAATRLATAIRDEGVIYNEVVGSTTVARDWQVDPVPLLVDGVEWSDLEKAIIQRSTLLDLLLRDLYRDQKTIRSGLIPPEMVFGHPAYIRKAVRLEVPGPHALFLHAIDLGRAPDGRFEVFADRTQAPSGIGFAMIDRRLLSRTFPQLFQTCAPRPVTTFVGTLRLALFDYAPPGVDDPTVAVLSPGSMSETAFDQAHLASILGFPLVEGNDLTVRDGVVYMRSLGKHKRVDVLLRRIDAEYADPLDLRTDSRLGVAGLVEAISRGTVTVVNTLGAGVVESPAMHTVLEKLAPVLIDEELALPSVPTYWAGDDLQRGKILADMDSMVLSNVRSGEEVVVPLVDAAARAELAARVEAQTWQWVGRELRPYSVAPTMTPGRTDGPGTAALRAAPVGIRAFSVAQGPTYAVMPGGLGAVLADGPAGSAVRTVAAKDIWVTSADVGGHVSRRSTTTAGAVDEAVARGATRPARTLEYSDVAAAASPRVLADLFWFGRYGERTEATTRLAKVARERYQEVQYRPWMSGTAAVPLVLHATGLVTGTATYLRTDELISGEDSSPSPERVADAIAKLTDLTAARLIPGTIAHSVERLVASARAVRDQMSTSTWMVLAPVERALEQLTTQVRTARESGDTGDDSTDSALDLGSELGHAHDEVLHGVLALAGLQAESMVHDAGWRYMDIGRRIERAVTLVDLTRALFADHRDREIEQALLESYLVANESSVIYRRRNRGLYQLDAVAELLFFDESNPRSLTFQFSRMQENLAALPDALRSAAAERIVEELVAELRRSDPDDLATVDTAGHRSDLDDLMTALGTGVRDLSDVLNRTRFAPPRQAQPIWGGGGVSP
ncbi:circularly permuted type 2 ATP-grasp protein [Gordonia prachuapensis]|uniref:circularly permuted type 2 ATP-grasp protein n=1 Tax=Gordonia prachuapensis TaxID=3115651 RepID=UPI003D668899